MLDVGCGGGLVSEPLARMGASVTGLDPGRENVEAARAHVEGRPGPAGSTSTTASATVEELAAEGFNSMPSSASRSSSTCPTSARS